MGLESATYISQLDNTFPLGSDQKSQGDDHLRLIKSVLKNQFPAFGAAALAASNTQIDKVVTTISINTGAPATAISVDASGNVGIGTATPGSKFHLNGSGTVAGLIQTSTASDAYVRTTTSIGSYGSGTGIGSSANIWNVYDFTAGASRINLNSAGQVGIGIVPALLFQAYGTGSQSMQVEGTSNGDVAFRAKSALAYFGMGASIGATVNKWNVYDYNAGVERIAIDGSGTFTYASREVGYRDVPFQSQKSSSYTLVATDRGTAVPLGAGASVVVPNGVFSAGAVVTLVNLAGTTLSVSQGAGFTLYLAGSSSTGTRTLPVSGVATIVFFASNSGIITGAI